jgi:hypothetical protein
MNVLNAPKPYNIQAQINAINLQLEKLIVEVKKLDEVKSVVRALVNHESIPMGLDWIEPPNFPDF